MGGVPREHTMLKGHLPRVIFHRVYKYPRVIYYQVYRYTKISTYSVPHWFSTTRPVTVRRRGAGFSVLCLGQDLVTQCRSQIKTCRPRSRSAPQGFCGYMTLGRCPLSTFCSRGTPPTPRHSTWEHRDNHAGKALDRCRVPHTGVPCSCRGASLIQGYLAHAGVPRSCRVPRSYRGRSYRGTSLI